ncbi:zinc ribbon domain-containing protein [Gracilibacillus massiliensis]|uniref:zinc ribbon domain-containing protein n=1 Tax=Gracilibacillus massiliensis TaxID=1564956 RepID=UPI00071C391F|nr:zinc ribbon domain-containing protein [Gracilibacillus massiliensis]
MSFCPKCGGQVQEIETFCVSCGKRLPEDLKKRNMPEKPTKKWWFLPVLSIVIASIILFSTYLFTTYQSDRALAYYQEAEEMALIGDYEQAKDLLQQALQYKEKFPSAREVLNFLQVASDVEHNLQKVQQLNENKNFSEAFDAIRQSENELEKYNGDLVDQMTEKTISRKSQTLLNQASYKLNSDPTIEDLKSLVWETKDLSHEQAPELIEQVHQKLVAMTYQEATSLLDNLQFSHALRTIEDTLAVIENSEQLESLKTTINKEKTAFESAQEQRIEQALSIFEEEQELNESHAIELIDIQLKTEDEKWLISGQLKSVATVPIHSILVSYSITDKSDEVILENEVYVYPETLYPDETGKFEFTHFDASTENSRLTAKVDEITWYLE